MPRLLAALAAALLAVLALAGCGDAVAADRDLQPAGTHVTLAANGGSGVAGQATITGRHVTATATGLTPGRRYISLYYGSMSTPTPGQLLTCADARTAALPRAWGITPEWKVDPQGDGTLDGTAPRDLADGVYTMSIRQVPLSVVPAQTPTVPGVLPSQQLPTGQAGQLVSPPADPYLGFNPATYPVVACGATR